MKRPQYTRYALRLGLLAGARRSLRPRPLRRRPDGRPAEAPIRPDPDDDWSGAAAYVRGPDAQALEYAAPDAVTAILTLQPAGWQEEDDGRTLVFWLEDGAEADAAVGAAPQASRRLRPPRGRERAARLGGRLRRFHRPHVIGRLYVRPPWYPARDDLLDIAVEAGLAFGTGGHSSTRQCLELIQTRRRRARSSTSARARASSRSPPCRLGFAPVTGIDIDPVAVHAAAGNAAMNGLAPTFLVGDATDPAYPLPAAEVVVANIALRPILRLAERWRPAEARRDAARDTARLELLLSGLLVEQADEALAALPAFAETARTDDGTWLTLHLTRRA